MDKYELTPIGTVVRLKGGKKDLEFRGMGEVGMVSLYDRRRRISYLVRPEDVSWWTAVNEQGRENVA